MIWSASHDWGAMTFVHFYITKKPGKNKNKNRKQQSQIQGGAQNI